MANTRFCASQDNKVLRYNSAVTYPRIINGLAGAQYPSAPALVEDSQYPTSNLHIPDRYTPWATPAGTTPSSMLLHIDLGSNVTVGLVAILGFRLLANAIAPSCTVGYRVGTASSPTFGYAATGYTSVGTPSLVARRDSGLVVGPVSARYWEFSFPAMSAAGYAFGGVYLGAITQDLGMLYSPGMEDEIVHQVVRGRTGGGHLSVITVGDTRRLVRMPFDNIEDAVRTKIDTVFGEASRRDPAIWLDRSDQARQVVLAQDSIAWRHNWDVPNLWSTELELEVLG